MFVGWRKTAYAARYLPPMQVPVGWRAFASRQQELEFRCRQCGHQARAEVLTVGSGESGFFGGLQRARRRANRDAGWRSGDKIKRTRCPKCGQRDPRVLWIFGGFHAACLIVLTGLLLWSLSIPTLIAYSLFMWMAVKAIRVWWQQLDEGIRWLS
jgi:hypothetical protein